MTPLSLGWTRGKNGRGTVYEKSRGLRLEGRRRRGRPRLGLVDCMKRDLVEVGGEGSTRVRDGGVEMAVKWDP